MRIQQQLSLTSVQEQALRKGAEKRNRMNALLLRCQDVDQEAMFPHIYISSRPGLGKSHSAISVLSELETPYFTVNGSTSLFGFAVALAVVNYHNPCMLSINILVDDCDSLFNDVASINLMKNVLGKTGELRYEKSLSSQLNFLSEEQRSAISHFASDGRMGFCVPTSNMRFIFTSNIILPTDEQVHLAAKKQTNSKKTILMIHQNAIRSRVRALDIELAPYDLWGWIADVVLHTSCISSMGLGEDQMNEIIQFLWDHWTTLSERSIRTAQKMAETMLLSPDSYESIWEMDFIK
jgi:hypothetical protein